MPKAQPITPDTDTSAADAVTAKIKATFDKLVGANKSEDEIKMGMISSGATFKNVTRLYNQFAVDNGLVLGKEDKAKIIAAAIEGADLTVEEGFKGAVDKAMAAGSAKGMTEASASSLIRKAAKAAEIECWKKPKGEGKGATGFAATYYAWLVANPTASADEAAKVINGTDGHPETSENTKRHLSHYQNIRQLANNIAAA